MDVRQRQYPKGVLQLWLLTVEACDQIVAVILKLKRPITSVGVVRVEQISDT